MSDARGRRKQVPLYGRIISGSVGGFLTSMLTIPLDVIKVRMQSWAGDVGPAPAGPSAANAVRAQVCCPDHGAHSRSAGGVPGEHFHHHRHHHHNRMTGALRSSPRSTAELLGVVPRTSILRDVCAVCLRGCHCTAVVGAPATGVLGMPAPAMVDVAAAATRSAAIASAQAERLRSTVGMAVHLLRSEGFSSLYRGLLPTLLKETPNTTVYYALNNQLKNAIEDSGLGFGPSAAAFLAGTGARTVAASIVAPMELIRTKMQAKGYPYRMVEGMLHEVRSNGVRALYAGLPPTLWRDVPFSGIYWVSYENLRNVFASIVAPTQAGQSQPCLTKAQQFCVSFAGGATSGMIAAVCVTPFDVVKTQVQVAMHRSDPKSWKSPSIPAVMRTIVREEGLRGLVTGAVPRVLKCAPACAVMLSSYEVGKMFFEEEICGL